MYSYSTYTSLHSGQHNSEACLHHAIIKTVSAQCQNSHHLVIAARKTTEGKIVYRYLFIPVHTCSHPFTSRL